MHTILTSEDTGGKWLVRYEYGDLYLYQPETFRPETGEPHYFAPSVTLSSNPKRALRQARKMIRAHDREVRQRAQRADQVRKAFESAT